MSPLWLCILQLFADNHSNSSKSSRQTDFRVQHQVVTPLAHGNSSRRCLKVIVGIWSWDPALYGSEKSAKEKSQRQVWRRYGLSKLGTTNSALQCGFNYAFVFGRTSTSDILKESNKEEDIKILSLPEGVNNGKSIAWFRYVVQNYKNYDYVFKIDSDTRICPSFLLYELYKANRSAYVGTLSDCGPFKHCKLPFSYFSGGLYGLSFNMLNRIVERFSEIPRFRYSFEDMNTGHWVYHFDPKKAMGRYDINFNPRENMTGVNTSIAVFNQRNHLTADIYPAGCIDREAFSPGNEPLGLERVNCTRLDPVPMVVYAFWFGKNMSGARRNAYKSLITNVGVPVVLVTSANLHTFNLTESPMHPAVDLNESLSKVHLTDYLRVYFMHHYGGGYHDVKPRNIGSSWKPYFEKINKDCNVWMYGISEEEPGAIGCDESYVLGIPECDKVRSAAEEIDAISKGRYALQGSWAKCCDIVRSNWRHMLANGAYIMRPNTLLTKEWLKNVESHLTAKYEMVKEHPAPKQRCCQPNMPPYPFRWAELHGEALHPLQVKYQAHLSSGLTRWANGQYRDEKVEDSLLVVH